MRSEDQENMPEVVERAALEVEQHNVPSYWALRRTRILIIVYLLLFVAFGVLAWVVHIHPVLWLDVLITREFQEHQLPGLYIFMVAISYLGNQILIFSILIAVTAVAFWLVRLRLEALFILGLSLISSPINVLLKLLIGRPRPTANLVDILSAASGKSFPSGHVMSYVAYWGLLLSFGLILFKRDRWWHYLLLVVPAFFVVMVGPSRIYLGDHWASDVLGAYLLGGLLLGLALWLYLALKSRGVLATNSDRQMMAENNRKPVSDKNEEKKAVKEQGM
jgi:Membrane-associated phospholipid phosphatase